MKMITIMADCGGSLYAWEKEDSDDTTFIGGLAGDGGGGFWGSHRVSKRLQGDLGAWAGQLERHCLDASFDWKRFDEAGIALARRLKAELGASARVVYHKPWEDPEFVLTERTEIMSDGSLRLLRVRPLRPGDGNAP